MGEWIVGIQPIEESCHGSTGEDGKDQSDGDTHESDPRALTEDQAEHLVACRSERQADADLVEATADAVGDDAVETHGGQPEADQAEGAGEVAR